MLDAGIVVALVLSVGSLLVGAGFATASYPSHSAISIVGDSGFTAANGVVSGDGTFGNPYVIEGWDIATGSQYLPVPAIAIKGTDAYFVIRNVSIHGVAGATGIDLADVHNGSIQSTQFMGVSAGIEMYRVRDFSVLTNTFTDVFIGIYASESGQLVIHGNLFDSGGILFGTGAAANAGTIEITPDNLVGGLPIWYFADRLDFEFSAASAGEVLLINATNARVSALDLGPSGFGVNVLESANVTVDGVHSPRIRVSAVREFVVRGSSAQEIRADTSTRGTIEQNTVYLWSGYKADGIAVDSSTDVAVVRNSVYQAVYGIHATYASDILIASNVLTGDTEGVDVEYSGRVQIVGNAISGSSDGVFVYEARGIGVLGNSIQSSEFGIRTLYSQGVLVHHNNFIDNFLGQVSVTDSQASFNLPYPLGGNFWSDYTGRDHKSGSDQNQPGKDGFGDTPYVNDGMTDQYPLMSSYTLPPTMPTLGPLAASPSVVIPGQDVHLEATADDPEGDPLSYEWTFDDGSVAMGTTVPGATVSATHAYLDLVRTEFSPALTAYDGKGGWASSVAVVSIAGTGPLRVRTSIDSQPDAGVPGTIYVDDVPMDEWGLSWVKIAEGGHRIRFSDVPGLGTPEPTTAEVFGYDVAEVVGTYRNLGWLRVRTDPPVPSTILVDGIPRDDWGIWMAVPPGNYTVSFGFVPDYSIPPPQTVTVEAGQLTEIVGSFEANDSAPGGISPPCGFLRVTTSTDDGRMGLDTQVRVDGVPRDEWGLSWLKLPPSTYTVSFSDVPGFGTPEPQTVTVVAGQTTELQGVFRTFGSLRVVTDPPVAGTIFVDGLPRDDWGMWQAFAPGTHKVSFGPLAGYATPPPLIVQVEGGNLTTVTGAYTVVAESAASTGSLGAFASEPPIKALTQKTGALSGRDAGRGCCPELLAQVRTP